MSIALDRDGDFAVNLVNDNKEWPQIQLIPAHRIATRTADQRQPALGTGPYKGYWINNGVISNDAGRTLAINVSRSAARPRPGPEPGPPDQHLRRDPPLPARLVRAGPGASEFFERAA